MISYIISLAVSLLGVRFLKQGMPPPVLHLTHETVSPRASVVAKKSHESERLNKISRIGGRNNL